MRYIVVGSMILLHVGIDLTMNMHIFEWLSIIGWCMFLFESDESQPTTSFAASSATNMSALWKRRWCINLFLTTVILTFFIDTFPIIYMYEGFVCLLRPITGLSLSSPGLRSLSKSVSKANAYRKKVFINPFVLRYLDPLGLYQEVWDMYSDASDEFLRFETILSFYKKSPLFSSNASDESDIREDYRILSPDWSTMTWYEKKRWQRLMTMYDSFQGRMCFDCFAQYQARQFLEAKFGEGNNSTAADFRIASIRLKKHVVAPRPPPDFDDWWNWTGWFYADAKQTMFSREPSVSLYVLNFCDDLSDRFSQWKEDGLCDAVSNHHVDRYSYNSSFTDKNRFALTQLCRRSCHWCPEHGYEADTLWNGTRISVIWPIPSKIGIYEAHAEVARDDAMYYDATIVQVVDRPMKQYLLMYDERNYGREWFDPITLRERGYRLLPAATNLDLGVEFYFAEKEHILEPTATKTIDEL